GLAFLSAMLHEDLTTGIGWGPGPHGVALNALAAQSRVALNPWWHGIATEYPNWGASYMPYQVPFPAGPVSVRTTAIRATEAGNAAINRCQLKNRTQNRPQKRPSPSSGPWAIWASASTTRSRTRRDTAYFMSKAVARKNSNSKRWALCPPQRRTSHVRRTSSS